MHASMALSLAGVSLQGLGRILSGRIDRQSARNEDGGLCGPPFFVSCQSSTAIHALIGSSLGEEFRCSALQQT
jgi:hypothetical protein